MKFDHGTYICDNCDRPTNMAHILKPDVRSKTTRSCILAVCPRCVTKQNEVLSKYYRECTKETT